MLASMMKVIFLYILSKKMLVSFLKIYYVFTIHVCAYVQVSSKGRRGCWHSPELELQVIRSCLVLMLGTKLRLPVKAETSLNSELSGKMSPAPSVLFANTNIIHLRP